MITILAADGTEIDNWTLEELMAATVMFQKANLKQGEKEAAAVE